MLPPAPDAGDPPGLRAQAMQLFEAFVQLIGEAPAERQHTQFVLQLKELELLKAMPLSPVKPVVFRMQLTIRSIAQLCQAAVHSIDEAPGT